MKEAAQQPDSQLEVEDDTTRRDMFVCFAMMGLLARGVALDPPNILATRALNYAEAAMAAAKV